jgi:hypothetical protein
MRCGQAQRLMTSAVDEELGPRRRRALDRHLTACDACRREIAATGTVLDAVAQLPAAVQVSSRLEEATLRRLRIAASEERTTHERVPWWRNASLPALALAAAAVLALAVGLRQFDVMSTAPANLATGSAAKRGGQAPQHRVPSEAAPARVARQARPTVGEPPGEPPAELASAPDLFMDLPILRHMEKLEHFDAIRTTTLDEEPGPSDGQQERSNG